MLYGKRSRATGQLIADSTSSLWQTTTPYNADISNPIPFLFGQDCSSINNSKPLKGSRESKEN
jgi:hypothetical protein